jgi:hypothetical protein
MIPDAGPPVRPQAEVGPKDRQLQGGIETELVLERAMTAQAERRKR